METGSRSGLSQTEADRRLRAEGFNELPASRGRTFGRILLEVLREPMLALLLCGAAVYLALGDLTEALILLVFATLSIVITVVQESRTERVLEALRDLSSPRALVIRDGSRRRIAGREVARGDLVVLSEGDRVPADAWLVEATNLSVDESLLTGESLAVSKEAGGWSGADTAEKSATSDARMAYSGTLVVRGEALALVTATGLMSEIGKIGRSLAEQEGEPPRLQTETRRLVRLAAVLGIGFSAMAVLLYGLSRGAWLEAFLSGIALGMAMLPEEFPVVLTVFLAMGTWRISQARVLTRRAASIEALGATTVLCTDKTGTLTENRMAIVRLWTPEDGVFAVEGHEGLELPSSFDGLVAAGRLASAIEPFDPMEKAFQMLSGAAAAPNWRLRRVYGLKPDLLAITQVWDQGNGEAPLAVAAKGAPEAIAQLCRLDEKSHAALTEAANAMAAEGMRVLGAARAEWSGQEIPDHPIGFPFLFLGLIGFADPLRASVPEAVRECRMAGVRVIMITGDYPATARTIAQQAGLAVEDVVSGQELAAIDNAELSARVRTATVFARISPHEKLRIVNALKANGEIVAMTGDGVNDAPSLKAAHVGVAMGSRGTDVAREASSIVLLDDDFGSIVKAIRLGRRIHDNLRKVMGFIIAVHVPIACMALLPLAFGLPILFTPIHIAFLEMVIDPVCSLVFEAEQEEDDVMQRPPRPPDQPLLGLRAIATALVQGAIAFLPAALLVAIGVERGMPVNELRALAFVTVVLCIVSLIFVHRSFGASLKIALSRHNTALAIALLSVALIMSVTLLWPTAGQWLRFGPLHADDLAMSIAGAATVLVVLQLLKVAFRLRPPREGRRGKVAAS